MRKNRNKTGNAYKVLNISSITPEELAKLTKNIQTLPSKLNRETLDKKKLVELFEIRKKQNEKIMRARTLGSKKILRYNIDTVNEIISQKIVESITKTLNESKTNTLERISHISKKAIRMTMKEIEKNMSCAEID